MRPGYRHDAARENQIKENTNRCRSARRPSSTAAATQRGVLCRASGELAHVHFRGCRTGRHGFRQRANRCGEGVVEQQATGKAPPVTLHRSHAHGRLVHSPAVVCRVQPRPAPRHASCDARVGVREHTASWYRKGGTVLAKLAPRMCHAAECCRLTRNPPPRAPILTVRASGLESCHDHLLGADDLEDAHGGDPQREPCGCGVEVRCGRVCAAPCVGTAAHTLTSVAPVAAHDGPAAGA